MPRPAPDPLESSLAGWAPSRRRAAVGLTVFIPGVLASLLGARAARADGPEVADLKYDRPAALAGCPDEVAFRRAVIDRLRRDPFVPGAARKISVQLTQNGSTLTALVRVDEVGHARGERRIDTRSGCGELASGAALAVSIAIDPLVALGLPSQTEAAEPKTKPDATSAPKPAPPSAARSKPPAETPPVKPAPDPRSKISESRLFVRASERAWVGIVPKVSEGPTVGLGYQRGAWSLALDGLFVLPRSEAVAGTRRAVSVALVGAQLSPCLHAQAFRGCALFSSGALLAHGEGVDDKRTGTSFDAAAGLGFGYSFFVGRFFVSPSLQAALRLTKTELGLDGAPVWTTPRLLGSLGLEIGYDVSR